MGGAGRFELDDGLRAAVRELRDGSGRTGVGGLFAVLRPRLLRYFAVPPFSREDAEDLVQTTLTLVVQRAETLKDVERFVGWLYAIARNVKSTARERLARERRVIEDDGDVVEPADAAGSTAERLVLARELHGALREAWARLPPRQRQCLALRVRDELSYAEIGELLRLDPLTVRNHIAQARKGLRGFFRDDGERRER